MTVLVTLCDRCGGYPAKTDEDGHYARCEDCRGCAS